MASRKPPARPWSAQSTLPSAGSLNFVGGPTEDAASRSLGHPWLRNQGNMQSQPRPVSAQARLALPPAASATRPGSASSARPGSAASSRPGSATGGRVLPGKTQDGSTEMLGERRSSLSHRPGSSSFSQASSSGRAQSSQAESEDEDAQFAEKHSGKVNCCLEPLVIYKLGSIKVTTQNDLHENIKADV